MERIETLLLLYLLLFVLSHLSKGENITSCEDGYSPRIVGDKVVCSVCSVCPHGKEVSTKCTNESDTVCRSCDLGTFSRGGFKCLNCSDCPPGTFVSSYCTLTSDTKCEPCAEGTYSDTVSAPRCKTCSMCSRLKTVLKNCTRTNNYECGGCVKGYFRHPNLPTCMKCSYCYPDHNITFPVPECTTQTDDPDWRCMPVAGPPRDGLVMSAGPGSSAAMSLKPPSTSVEFIVTSHAQYSKDSIMPPHVSIPIIVVGISFIVIVAILAIIYKSRSRCNLLNKRKSHQNLHMKESNIARVMIPDLDTQLQTSSASCLEQTSCDEENEEGDGLPLRNEAPQCNVSMSFPSERTLVNVLNCENGQKHYENENEGFDFDDESSLKLDQSSRSPSTRKISKSQNVVIPDSNPEEDLPMNAKTETHNRQWVHFQSASTEALLPEKGTEHGSGVIIESDSRGGIRYKNMPSDEESSDLIGPDETGSDSDRSSTPDLNHGLVTGSADKETRI